ncbi:MAG TPA: enoyl-CoA hydratase-related protein [Nevskiaceae bacterium]|nr:enoyl-CoA hydratase-related protein [Nevskiaceae bacterium]
MAELTPDEAVTYSVTDRIATITLNDPAQRNALSRAIRTGLRNAFSRFEADAEARVAILTGSGDRAFCAGANLKEMAGESLGVPPPGYVAIVGRDVHLSKPLIGAVNGVALGGGLLLAQMTDLLVAVEGAIFGMPEGRVGRGAPWSIPLARMIPKRIWLELCLTGEAISAQRAYEIGFVNHVVPRVELMSAAMKIAQRIVANAPLTMSASLKMVAAATEMGQTAAWDEADRLFVPVYESQDALEGPRAFREGRPPHWQNR